MPVSCHASGTELPRPAQGGAAGIARFPGYLLQEGHEQHAGAQQGPPLDLPAEAGVLLEAVLDVEDVLVVPGDEAHLAQPAAARLLDQPHHRLEGGKWGKTGKGNAHMRNHTLQSSHSCSTLHKPRPCGSPRSSDTPNPSFVVFLPSSLQFLHSGIISGTANTDEVSFQTSAVPSPRAAPHSSGSACPASAELWGQGNQLKAAKVSGGGVLKPAETVPL